MQFTYERIERLPRLAWGLTRLENSERAAVAHGTWVETRDRAFVEGVWDGDFADLDFARTNGFFGSGGIVDQDGFTLVSTAATTDCIHYSQRADRFVASNSLPLLLRHLNATLFCFAVEKRRAVYTEALLHGAALPHRENRASGVAAGASQRFENGREVT